CLSAADQNTRLTLMKQAVASLKSSRATYVYIDAGNSGWHPAATMAPRLQQAGIAGADGFSLNVSNFYATAQSVSYGNQLSGLVGGKHYVVDTSRNGKGALSGEAWCNPPGRALGANPTTVQSSGPLVDALLWIKTPGQSDGTCNGGPPAGSWWADYALGLARTAGW
ncbi:MAG TPA: glycoside hydrolase family 6 protein, partial [Candidatus Limnocylindrales bacterium]|nr:glycoside hydrolase family 6 protein [Candidatus Limnocylindrales bacterium]